MRRRKVKFVKDLSKKKKEKIQLSYLGLDCDSMEEKMFLYWCEELIQAGYIQKVERARSYILTDGVTNSYAKQMKTKSKSCTECLLKPSSYNPDFEILWTDKGLDKFCWTIGSNSKKNRIFINDFMSEVKDHKTTVEVKGSFNAENMIRLFQNNRKFLYQRHNVFVNLVVPDKLFEETFIPAKAMLTPTGLPRKINYKIVKLNQFLNI